MDTRVTLHNADIANVFDEIGDLLELAGENTFRVRAYRNAARVLGELGGDIATRLEHGESIPKLPGFGADLEGKLHEIAATGTCPLLDELHRRFPRGITELLRLPGLGPKRVALLHRKLRVTSLPDLDRAVRAGRLRGLRGFGEKTERTLAEALRARDTKARRFLLALAAQYAEPFARYLDATAAGSYRRRKETVGDLDFLVASKHPVQVVDAFAAYPEVVRVLARGTTKASVVLACGIQCDLRVVAPESFGAALHYFTGSKAHNIAVRKLGIERGLKINEYGVFRGARRIAGETEESVYASVGLPWIAPELREDLGEIEAAANGKLPQLVTLDDLQGDLHAHTSASDGRQSIAEMAAAARVRGLKYIAITDHSRGLAIAHGLDPARLARQGAAIDALNAANPGVRVLKGIEVDILGDGRLDLPDAALAKLDIVVAAVHSRFALSRARQTARILAALDHPRVSILAHPTGRLIDEREPYDVDIQAVIAKARARGIALEIDAQPNRLDLSDVHCRMAKDAGIKLAIDSDAHTAAGFDDLHHGVAQARRGWLEKTDVLNARPLGELQRLIRKAPP